MYARPTAPRSIGGVLDDAIRLFRASFAYCWALALAAAIVTGTASLYVSGETGALARVGRTAGTAAMLTMIRALGHSPGLWAADLVIVVVAVLIRAAIIRRQVAVAEGTEESAGEALLFAIRRLPSIIVAFIVFCVIVGVGFALLIVPGVWAWGRLQLWMVALCAEDLGPFQALGRSWELVEGHWWRASTIVFVAFVIILVLSLIEGVVAGVSFFALGHDPAVLAMLTQLLSAILSVFTMPMLTVTMLAVLQDLKVRREGGDLAARMGSL